jgi:hypothetical protein
LPVSSFLSRAATYYRVSNINSAIAQVIETARTESPVVQTTEGMLMRMSEDLRKVGSSVAEVIKDTRLALEAVCAQYAAEVGAELRQLRPLFDNKVKGFAEFANKYIKVDYEHILGIAAEFSRRGLAQIGGFHHDFMQLVEKSGVIEFADKVMYEHGFYKATLLHNGEIAKRTATFFPAHWSREEVISKIYEAYNNFIKDGAKIMEIKGGKYRFQGFTEEGIKIEMYVTLKGHLVTAYPVLG